MISVLWNTGAWRLLVMLLVYISGMLFILPVLPGLVTNDFASRKAGEELHCEGTETETEQPFEQPFENQFKCIYNL